MPEFIITVGISGSGKSHWCYEQHNITTDIVADSDEIRRELWGDANDQQNPDKVFSEMFARTKSALSHNINVFYCATNLGMKYRIHTLNQIKRLFPDVKCRAVVFNTPLSICKEWNKKRERQVPDWLFERQIKQFQMPVYNEGWDSIEIVTPAEYNRIGFSHSMWNDVRAIGSQDNPHHTLTLYDHLQACVDNLKLPTNEEDSKNLCIAAALHDVGKAYTRSYDENGVAHYYAHENYSAYIAMNMRCNIEIIQLVNYHMLPFNTNAIATWKKRLGNSLWNKIMILHEADIAAK